MPHLAGNNDTNHTTRNNQVFLASDVIGHMVWLLSVLADMTTVDDRYYIVGKISRFLDVYFDVFVGHATILRSAGTRRQGFTESVNPNENAIYAKCDHIGAQIDGIIGQPN